MPPYARESPRMPTRSATPSAVPVATIRSCRLPSTTMPIEVAVWACRLANSTSNVRAAAGDHVIVGGERRSNTGPSMRSGSRCRGVEHDLPARRNRRRSNLLRLFSQVSGHHEAELAASILPWAAFHSLWLSPNGFDCLDRHGGAVLGVAAAIDEGGEAGRQRQGTAKRLIAPLGVTASCSPPTAGEREVLDGRAVLNLIG